MPIYILMLQLNNEFYRLWSATFLLLQHEKHSVQFVPCLSRLYVRPSVFVYSNNLLINLLLNNYNWSKSLFAWNLYVVTCYWPAYTYQTSNGRWRLSSSFVVVCNTPPWASPMQARRWRFLGGKGGPSSCFVTISRDVEVMVKKLRKPGIVYILCITSMVMINCTHNRGTQCT